MEEKADRVQSRLRSLETELGKLDQRIENHGSKGHEAMAKALGYDRMQLQKRITKGENIHRTRMMNIKPLLPKRARMIAELTALAATFPKGLLPYVLRNAPRAGIFAVGRAIEEEVLER